MRVPDSLVQLLELGVVDEVIRPLKSGKEAQVYLVSSEGSLRVAKVYKEPDNRSFKNRADYIEGRNVRNTRDQRAMDKGSKHGREKNEAAWRSTEVDMIYRLAEAGVRVPKPYHFVEGVLIMELVCDARGEPAPRLGEIQFTKEAATRVYTQLLREVQRMLCAGIVHGDLSDFNVLMAEDGPVVIDFPQSVNASRNQSAKKLLLRDVDNLHRFMGRFSPGFKPLPYAEELWQLYERGELTPGTELSGRYIEPTKTVNTTALLGLVADAAKDERARREQRGLSMHGVGAESPRDSASSDSSQGESQEQSRPLSKYARKLQEQPRPKILVNPHQKPKFKPGGVARQPQGGSRPQQGGPRPQQGGPRPQQGGPRPQQGGPRPQQGGPHPQQGGPRPQQDARGPRPQQDARGPRPQQGGPRPQQDGRGPRPQQDARGPRPQHDGRGPRPQQDGPRPQDVDGNVRPQDGPNRNRRRRRR